MRAVVHVSFKKTVLDPQGRTVCSTLNNLGYNGVASVRQGKYFEIELSGDLSSESARLEVERIARDVLANPVIEEYEIEMQG